MANGDTTTTTGLPVLPAVGRAEAAAFEPWVRRFASAMLARNESALIALRSEGGVWHWNEPGTTYGPPAPLAAYGAFINFKVHILHALEVQMNLPGLWRPGASLLDVGSGPAWMSAYLAAKYSMRVVAYDVPSTGECKAFLDSPFAVNFFSGRIPEAPRSFDAVSILNVMHHAARHSGALLEQAATVARRWILVTEDLDLGWNRRLLRMHDTNGIFRNLTEWQDMFRRHCTGFALVRNGMLQPKLRGTRSKLFIGTEQDKTKRGEWLTFFVLERVR